MALELTIANRISRLETKVDKLLAFWYEKQAKAGENKSSYNQRKLKFLVEEDKRRGQTVQNPNGSAFQCTCSELWRVADAFVAKNRIRLLCLMTDTTNHAGTIVRDMVCFWINYYWEPPIRRSGGSFAFFTGWTTDRGGRLKAKRQAVKPSGDVVFLASKFGTTHTWDATKAMKLGESFMFTLLSSLMSRFLLSLQFVGEEMEEAPEWGDVNPETLKVLRLAAGDGWSFSDDPKDVLYLKNSQALWVYCREKFHKKIGKIMPVLEMLSKSFQNGVVQSC